MILDRLTFEYQEKILIEKIKVKTPFKYEGVFQDSGCFIYFKDNAPKLLSSEDNAQIKPQEAVLLKCGTHFLDLLQQKDNETIEVIIVHLYPEILKKLYVSELPALIEKNKSSKQSQIVASQDIISKFIDSLEFYFNNPSLINNDLLELKIKELILLLVQTKNITSIVELVADLYASKSVQLKKIVDLHLFSNLSVEDLAKLSNLSLSSFKRQFKKEFNDSPNNYITTKRLDKAKELLSITDMPINEIAYDIGYNDPLYFTRTFKKKIGISPTAYRVK
ncbi:AraC family transcriptional regulator [uncultured Dokdonia sp.]|uniref:helix-turn-helix domain-containing protein n=1 Tax=uncultured Dokdonia sp. TaxID=575653 RepID=UPI0026222199|nr:AraC family transcriptional regulator [uncultured Dokdonia sp.]